MKLAISNIAWDNLNNSKVYSLMEKHWFRWLEIAPTKTFENFLEATENEIKNFKEDLHTYWIEVIAAQSLLFWKPDLKLFNNSNEDLKQYLIKIIDFASKTWIKSLIFGSPKNRIYENISKSEAIEIAKKFFQEIWNYAFLKWVHICIEPNPEIYWWNFMCNTKETLEFVKYVNNPWIKLHLDLWTIIINNEDINIILEAKKHITHFHISEPNLEVIQEREIHYKLRDLLVWYDWYCSIEMKWTILENIEKSLILVAKILK